MQTTAYMETLTFHINNYALGACMQIWQVDKLINITFIFPLWKDYEALSCSQERLTLEMFALLSFQGGNLI